MNSEHLSNDLKTMSDPTDLTLKFNAEFRGAIGYGQVYHATVTELVSGDFSDGEFFLTVMHFDTTLDQMLLKGAGPNGFLGKFVRYQENVEENRLPITGFVDKEKVAWKLVKLE